MVHFPTDSARLDAGERAAVDAFLAALPEDATVEVVAFGGADPRAGRTYNLDLAARRARTLARLLEESGRRVRIDVRAVGETAAPGAPPSAFRDLRRVELIARVHRAVAIPCDGGAPVPARLGCSVRANLAAMIADPATLARPARLSAPDPDVVTDPVVRLRLPRRDAQPAAPRDGERSP